MVCCEETVAQRRQLQPQQAGITLHTTYCTLYLHLHLHLYSINQKMHTAHNRHLIQGYDDSSICSQKQLSGYRNILKVFL